MNKYHNIEVGDKVVLKLGIKRVNKIFEVECIKGVNVKLKGLDFEIKLENLDYVPNNLTFKLYINNKRVQSNSSDCVRDWSLNLFFKYSKLDKDDWKSMRFFGLNEDVKVVEFWVCKKKTPKRIFLHKKILIKNEDDE